MKVSVVIPVWHGRDYVPACLAALLEQAYPHLEILAVDNASGDGSAEVIERDYPQVRLIRSATNRGFSGGCNLGLAAAGGDLLVLLNQDTRVAAGWLAALVAAFQAQPEAGIVGCKALYPDSRQLQHAGGWVDWPLGYTHHYGYRETDTGKWDTPRPVEFVTGAAMAIRRAVLATIGALDEQFWPGYFEDVDYCLRARAAGFQVWYWPEAVVLHTESPTSDPERISRYYQRGRLRCMLKHLPPERFLTEFVSAERQGLLAAVRSPERHALGLAYLGLIPDLPGLLRQCWAASANVVDETIAAFQQLHDLAWQLDVQTLIDVPADSGPPALSAAPAPGSARLSLLGAADLLPEYVRLVQARQASAPAPEAGWLDLREYQFRSSLPVVGQAIARVRQWWYGLTARWAVLHLMQQQEAVQRHHEAYLRQLSRRLADLAEEHALVMVRLAQHESEARSGDTRHEA